MVLVSSELLLDLAVLSTLSVVVHYFMGLYGIVGALLVFSGLEHGDTLWEALVSYVSRSLHGIVVSITSNGNDTSKTPPRTRRGRQYHRVHDEVEETNRRMMPGMNDPRALLEAHASSDNDQPTHSRQSLVSQDIDGSSSSDSRNNDLSSLIIRDIASRFAGEESNSHHHERRGRSPTQAKPRIQVNSLEPIAFENDLFVGKVLFLVRTNPEDPHWSELFVGKRRMFWIQVQGQFKRPPRGAVYLGGELPSRISPGILTRSIALVIVGILHKLVGKVNFSFGNVHNTELPSISFPLYQSVDQFMETPAGEEPPPLGKADFGETEEARQRRRQTPIGSERYEVGKTYSFHFHTMYVDLTQWRTANFPGMNDMSLSSFFDSLPLRLVAYDVHSPATSSENHLQQHKDYLFSFEVKYNQRRLSRVESGRQGSFIMNTLSGTPTTPVDSVSSTVSTNVSDSSVSDSDHALMLQGQAAFIDAENARRLGQLTFSFLCWMEEVDLSSGIRRVFYIFSVKSRDSEDDDGSSQSQLGIVSAYAIRSLLAGYKSDRSKTNVELSDLRFHCQSRIGSYSTISSEAIQIVEYLKFVISSTDITEDELELELELEDRVSLETSSDGGDSSLISIQSALYQLLTQRTRLQQAQTTNTTCSPSKLGVNLSKRDREDMQVVFEGVVYRYYSESFLRQEVLVITSDELLFYRSYSSSAEKAVQCNRVIGVQAIKMPYAEDLDDSCAFAFQINTFAEEIAVSVGTEQARKSWIRAILQHCNPQINFERSLTEETYICYTPSKLLRPANRTILNSRSLFPPQTQTTMSTTTVDPMAMVTQTLKRALHIHNANHITVMDILDFLNLASALRGVNLEIVQQQYSHEEKMAFYLNLYHVIVAHAMISYGFPRGKSQWQHFLTHMCYAVGMNNNQQMNLSLAEIEHLILRKRMHPADLPHLRFDAVNDPKDSRLTGLGIAHPDFRLSFALVMHQEQTEGSVVIYNPKTVHDQLNAVVQNFLVGQVEVHPDRNCIVLPRVCEWYRQDFGGEGSGLNCARKLLGFLDDLTQRKVVEVLDSPFLIQIKYRAFNYSPKSLLKEKDVITTTDERDLD